MTSEELARLRREVWADGSAGLDEAEGLIELNSSVDEDDSEWAGFFVETLTEFLIARGRPRGYVTDEDADWLTARLGSDGRITSATELGLLDHLFERAEFVPLSLKAFALDAVEKAVRDGAGPTRGGSLDPGSINQVEVELLRRFLFAPAGDGPAYVTRPEAEMMWRLKDRALGQANAPEWKDLWVKALSNHLLASPPDGMADRNRALEQEKFLATPPSGLGNFVSRMVTSRPDFAGAIAASGWGDDEERDQPGAGDNGLDHEERAWTEGKVIEDGDVDEYEQALLEAVVQ